MFYTENMIDDNEQQLSDDEEIKKRVRAAWSQVFTASNKILVDGKKFGFSLMEAIPDPNIHQMMVLMSFMDAGLKEIGTEFAEDLSPKESIMLLNARKQILNMEAVAVALRKNDKTAFDEAMHRLDEQAPF